MVGFFDGNAALMAGGETKESYLKVKNSLTREILESPEYLEMYRDLLKRVYLSTDFSNKNVKNPELITISKLEEPARTILLFADFDPIKENEVLHPLHPFFSEKDRKALAERCKRLSQQSRYK